MVRNKLNVPNPAANEKDSASALTDKIWFGKGSNQ